MRFLQIALLCGLLALLQGSVAEEFIVGGRAGWQARSVDYAQWSARNAYRPGDSLVFPYDQGAQSVMRVSQEDFYKCRTNNPIEHYVDGNTIVRLDRDNYYFISGIPGHCNAGMKLEVVLAGVLAGGTPSATPSSGPAVPPVRTPSASPKTPPTSTPVPSPPVAPAPAVSTPTPTVAPAPAVSTPTPATSAPSPVTAAPPSPLAAPVPGPATPTPSQSPLVSSVPPVFAPTSLPPTAEGPSVPGGNAASALSSSLATIFIALLVVSFSLN
ncbi:hypothetical protein O6H91_09G061300 [Diphasiastrum complanatum]|uniref:Uncharacterized protein n=2 Tax=Diphasiastrum complanatum TaxID=34168 RepID=A0ACC2CPN3_DIPCM|nr:hypothetical protein O6H91_09G061300 [Diphasiastrum complanatum]